MQQFLAVSPVKAAVGELPAPGARPLTSAPPAPPMRAINSARRLLTQEPAVIITAQELLQVRGKIK